MAGENATKKNWAHFKRMASWARQRQQITEAADGGARACTGADGAVVLNLRRGPGAWACGRPARTSTTTCPSSARSPTTTSCCATGRRSSCSLQGGEHRLTKLGKGFFRDKYCKYLVHVPVIIRGRRRSGRTGCLVAPPSSFTGSQSLRS